MSWSTVDDPEAVRISWDLEPGFVGGDATHLGLRVANVLEVDTIDSDPDCVVAEPDDAVDFLIELSDGVNIQHVTLIFGGPGGVASAGRVLLDGLEFTASPLDDGAASMCL